MRCPSSIVPKMSLVNASEVVPHKVRVEIMTSDDNLESNLLTCSLLKMYSLVQVELYVVTVQWQEMN